ncbi:hypothetical protein B0G66_1571 [Bacillus badius]|nr:hypothetical protein B0G66_1571 [Bacillus badius]
MHKNPFFYAEIQLDRKLKTLINQDGQVDFHLLINAVVKLVNFNVDD